jgi:ZIP family zinc transporter
MIPGWAIAGLWGLFSGSALILGAVVGVFFNLRASVIASVMAFGSGVLISALSFDLMDEAFKTGGFIATSAGFLGGAVIYTFAAWLLTHKGAKHRKRSNGKQVSEKDQNGSGLGIALGALLDGIPESIVIGLTLLSGKGVSLVAVAAIFISNIPEGLSSSSGMRKSGRSLRYIFSVWIGIALLSGLASLIGYSVFGEFPPEVVAATTAVAAGAILAMLIDTMIPEAFEGDHQWAGITTVVGFLVAFVTSKLGP